MNLEQKHVTPYLPYGLKGKFRFQKSEELLEVVKLDKNVSSGVWSVHFLNKKGQIFWCNILDFRPVLRPLTDLNKDLVINGDIINPINYLGWDDILEDYSNNIKKFCKYFWRNNPTYREVQKLLEWHFDVECLIEKGLAVNMNNYE